MGGVWERAGIVTIAYVWESRSSECLGKEDIDSLGSISLRDIQIGHFDVPMLKGWIRPLSLPAKAHSSENETQKKSPA